MIHTIKTWPGPFRAIESGEKRHEIRKDDRGYQVGDTLMLHEWDPRECEYTGATSTVTVTYKTEGGERGPPPGLCVLSILREG